MEHVQKEHEKPLAAINGRRVEFVPQMFTVERLAGYIDLVAISNSSKIHHEICTYP